jgi:hypothetical protein
LPDLSDKLIVDPYTLYTCPETSCPDMDMDIHKLLPAEIVNPAEADKHVYEQQDPMVGVGVGVGLGGGTGVGGGRGVGDGMIGPLGPAGVPMMLQQIFNCFDAPSS